MKESKADLILHPVRMRIIQTLVGGKRLAAQEMIEYLPDVPQASLYRHLKKLVDADLLEIVEENRIRGTVEKVYALPDQVKGFTEEDLLHLSRGEHMNLFMKFFANVLADYERYLAQDTINLKKDGVGYRQIRFFANEEELMEFGQSMAKAVGKLLENKPAPDRKQRILTTILMPGAEDPLKNE